MVEEEVVVVEEAEAAAVVIEKVECDVGDLKNHQNDLEF